MHETVIGYTSSVSIGGLLSSASGILLFTAERMLAVRAHGLLGGNRLWRDYLKTRVPVNVGDLLSKHENNFAIPYSEMVELHVSKPGVFLNGKVTVRTADGKRVLRIDNEHRYKDDWAFLRSPPPQLAAKLIVD
jgi:hypothetical protein